MDKEQSTTEEYFIIFTAAKHRNWMIKLLKSPFQHVYAVKKSEGGQFWIKINPLISHTDITLLQVAEYPHIRMLTNSYDVILPVKSIIKDEERWTFCVINCVEVVKSLIGIRAFWVWTPYQLYTYIKGGKNGKHKKEGKKHSRPKWRRIRRW